MRTGRLRTTVWYWKQSLETFLHPAASRLCLGNRSIPILGTHSPSNSKISWQAATWPRESSFQYYFSVSLTSSRFWERFLICRTCTLHTPSTATNTFITIMPPFPGSPRYVISLQMCLWRRKPSRVFYVCATAWQDISQLPSRNPTHHVNTVRSVS